MFGYELKKKQRPPKRSIETSKLLLVCLALGVASVTIFICIMMWRTNDLSPTSWLIPSMFGEFATATGFYYNKAKQENLNKHKTEGGTTGDQ